MVADAQQGMEFLVLLYFCYSPGFIPRSASVFNCPFSMLALKLSVPAIALKMLEGMLYQI